MNLANKLTLSRVIIIPFFIFFLLYEQVGSDLTLIASFRVMALLSFVYATITDIIDGIIARKYNMITNFGRLFDPLADKLLVSAAFISFVEMNIYPAWIVIVILSREFLITGLRTLGIMQGRVIHASGWGKHKTFWQIVTVMATLIFLCSRDILSIHELWAILTLNDVPIELICKTFLKLLIYICMFFTILSGFIYFLKNRDIMVMEVTS